jgi:diguanylate cyclase (GGDEF)-like protein
VAGLDYATGALFEVAALYVAAVMYAAWSGGRTCGLAAAALATAAIVVLGLIQGSPYSSPFYFAVNVVNKALIVVAIAFVVARARQDHMLATENARTDPLTRLANRRAFEERLTLEARRRAREPQALGCAFVDIDDFKEVNDRLGHDVGDAVLVAVAQAIAARLRGADLAARLGGDEFCVLLPGIRREEALAVTNRIRDELMAAMEKGGWSVTFSIGLAMVEGADATPAELIAQADRLMYEAKRNGKNRIAA